ncbi:MAG: hypothetical protein JWO58_1197 [Chitinophagaceae bacterium]|nr:hypothetical protein [Chitinophagaceae bacterium]
MGKILLSLSCCLLLFDAAIGQDVQLSQYYNAPLYLNPGFTGTGDNTRVGMNYRTQWRGIDKPFNTVSLWADHNIESYNSGIGLMYFRDEQGSSRLTTNEVDLLYSYSINVSDNWVIKPGLQGGIVARDANYASLLFADQLSANGATGGATSDPLAGTAKTKVYGDFSAGGIAFNDNAWFGLSFNHINRPNQAFFAGDYLPLPVKFSAQGGYKFYLSGGGVSKYKNYKNSDPEISITPTFLFKQQGVYNQLDIGAYLTYEPLMVGLWYRGLPVDKHATGLAGNEALVFMLGGYYEGFTLGYSYDYTISQLKGAGSVHELSLIYEFKPIKYKKARGKSAPCPKFNRRYQ